jgi:hydroxymethylbilane synthase
MASPRKKLNIGTRGSELALVQAKKVEALIKNTYPDYDTALVVVKTTGDLDQKSPLKELGGKGVFIKELEHALCNGSIDMAVHSLKDVTSALEPGLGLYGFLEPETTCDALVLPQHNNGGMINASFSCLRHGAKVGTGSLRRKQLLKKYRPDITTVDLRGNVGTRLQKMVDQHLDAVILSYAGLLRLNLDSQAVLPLDPQWFYPAPGQGVITVEARQNDSDIRQILESISHPRQKLISEVELTLLKHLEFDCRIPFGLHAGLSSDTLTLKAFLSDEKGDNFWESQFTCNINHLDNILLELMTHKKRLGW